MQSLKLFGDIKNLTFVEHEGGRGEETTKKPTAPLRVCFNYRMTIMIIHFMLEVYNVQKALSHSLFFQALCHSPIAWTRSH